MVLSPGIREVVVEYVWIEGSREANLQDRWELLNNKDWEAWVDCLEWTILISWWEWLVGSIYFLLRFPREFLSGIMDGQKQWHMGPWPRFLQPQIFEREKKVAEKECIKLVKVRKRGYVRM